MDEMDSCLFKGHYSHVKRKQLHIEFELSWLVFYAISNVVEYLMSNPVNTTANTHTHTHIYIYIYMLGIIHLFPHNELVHLPYIAVAFFV